MSLKSLSHFAASLSLALVCAMAAANASGNAPVHSLAFGPWSEAFAADWVRLSPERATFSQYFDAEEQASFDRQLTPHTPAQRGRRLALARKGLKELDAYPDAKLSSDERVSAAILRWSLQRTVDAAPFDDHDFLFNQLGGPHLRYIGMLAENHPLRRPADLDTLLARMELVDERLDQALATSRAAVARGFLPPRFIVERARTQVVGFLAQDADNNDIVAGLRNRSQRIAGLTPEQRDRAIASARDMVQQRLRPAYQRVLAFMDELLPRTTADAGLWRLPDGDKAYAQEIGRASCRERV